MATKMLQHMIQPTIKFKEDTEQEADIPTTRIIRQIYLKVKINLATDGTPATGIKNGGILNAIQHLKVKANGTADLKVIFPKLYAAVYPFQASGYTFQYDTLTAAPADNGNADYYMYIPLDFSVSRRNLMDLSAVLNAPATSSISVNIQWNKIGDLFTTAGGTTIDEDKSNVEIMLSTPVYNGNGNNDIDAIANNALDIREGVAVHTFDRAYTGEPTDALTLARLPVPNYGIDMAIRTVEDAFTTPVPKNDIMIRWGIKNKIGQGERIELWDAEILRRRNLTEYGITSTTETTGTYYVDWRDDRGLGFANFEKNAIDDYLQLAAPASSESDRIEIYQRYRPVRVQED